MSRPELVQVGTRFFIIEGDAAAGFELYRARLDHVAHARTRLALRRLAHDSEVER